MIFNSLRINNYRAYYGESIFDFPTEGERNISCLLYTSSSPVISALRSVLYALAAWSGRNTILFAR